MDIVHHGEEAYASGEGAVLLTPEAGIDEELPVAQPV
jgi:ammonium transporter, Amt family